MPKYRVTLQERRSTDYETSVVVEAGSQEEAEKRALEMCQNEEVDFGDPQWEDVEDTDIVDVEEV
jgi:hypothetical protein